MLILKMLVLISCTGKFCYGHGNFQNTEADTGVVFKSSIKFTGKHLCQSLFFNMVAGLRPKILFKRHRCFPLNFVKLLRMLFFSKYESLYMTAAVHSCLIKSCSENVWKISRSISTSDCKLQVL